jgi:hypothetical protein
MELSKIEKDVIERLDWSIDCFSPLEISNKDGAFATGEAAQIVIDYLLEATI